MQLSLNPNLQSAMRRAHLGGAPGIAVSGTVWLLAAIVCYMVGVPNGVWTLLIGGALISPVSTRLTKLLRRSAEAREHNALNQLAFASTIWLIACCFMAYGLYVHEATWFFPAMMVTIGSRYLVFATLFGLSIYWVLGGSLVLAGAAAFYLALSPMYAALLGATIELVFGAILFSRLSEFAA